MFAALIASVAAAAAIGLAAAANPGAAAPAPAPAPAPTHALVTADSAVLRAAARESAQLQAQLWQGELLEVRGERLDYLQVWDYRRERGGYVRASQVKRMQLAAHEAPELLAVLRFVRDTPGAETLAIAMAASWLRAAPVEALRGESGVEVLDALGTSADRLAHRASNGAALSRAGQARLSAQLEVAARYGVGFTSFERDARMQVCYDGDAFRRVLAMSSQPAQRARAALALTRPECLAPELPPLQRHRMNLWRADVLERAAVAGLPAYVANRLQMRRAAVWSSLAYEHARLGEPAAPAADRALAALASVNRSELPEEDKSAYTDAAIRVNASRWAGVPPSSAAPSGNRPWIETVAGQPGETCVLLVDAKHGPAQPLARRCTYALVWPQSASLNREGNALALAVQPMEGWREIWIFRKKPQGWGVQALPPASISPELGYAEFAGWVPGGRQMLVAREARGEGKYKRSYELLSLDSLAPSRQAADPSVLGAFQRWQDPGWKRMTVSLR